MSKGHGATQFFPLSLQELACPAAIQLGATVLSDMELSPDVKLGLQMAVDQ